MELQRRTWWNNSQLCNEGVAQNESFDWKRGISLTQTFFWRKLDLNAVKLLDFCFSKRIALRRNEHLNVNQTSSFRVFKNKSCGCEFMTYSRVRGDFEKLNWFWLARKCHSQCGEWFCMEIYLVSRKESFSRCLMLFEWNLGWLRWARAFTHSSLLESHKTEFIFISAGHRALRST